VLRLDIAIHFRSSPNFQIFQALFKSCISIVFAECKHLMCHCFAVAVCEIKRWHKIRFLFSRPVSKVICVNTNIEEVFVILEGVVA